MDGDQFDMFGAPTPRKAPKPAPLRKGADRLFFALYPDQETARQIQAVNVALRGDWGLTGKPRPVDHLHVTLRHVADAKGPPQEAVEALIAAASTVTFPAFDITLDSCARIMGSGAFVLLADPAKNAELIGFQKALAAALDGAGASWRVGGAGFTPHVMLSYETREAAQSVGPITWTARQFVLIHSVIGEAKHIRLARFPLS